METTIYTIPKISCAHCIMRIKKALDELEGIEDIQTDLTAKTVELSFTAPASDAAIRELLAEIGFPATENHG